MRSWSALVASVAVAGCFSPSPPEGLPCAITLEGPACPDPLTCIDGVCVRDGVGGPDASHPIDAQFAIDAIDPACVCAGDELACPAGPIACALGCVATSAPHCAAVIPSNGVGRDLLAGTGPVDLPAGSAIDLDTDTGAITGDVIRPAGTGVLAGIGFFVVPSSPGGPDLGVFTFDSVTVPATATVTVIGGNAAVVLVRGSVTIDGKVEVSAGLAGGRASAGPGGGRGATMGVAATGCGPGGDGIKPPVTIGDSGGGGGGGGVVGADGGASNNPPTPGGAGGGACLDALLAPLRGGSGGGLGGAGPVLPADGGGGGGALQITSLTSIAIGGRILASGAGGGGGLGGPTDGGAGAGGGSGGGILLEAPVILIPLAGIVAANGGGGGGAAYFADGSPGAAGQPSTAQALGGAPSGTSGRGGDGGAAAGPAQPGMVSSGAGGGGGATGVIAIRARMIDATGVISPPANTADVAAD